MPVSVGGKLPRKPYILPNNTGIKDLAQFRLERDARRYVEQYNNSLFVDGIPARIWIRQRAGRICTCGMDRAKLTGFTESDGPERQPDEAGGPLQFKPMRMRGGAELVVDEPPIEIVDGYSPYDDILEAGDPLAPGDSYDLYGYDRAECGICYGTGYTDGMRLHNGIRIVRDATSPHVPMNVSIDYDEKPNRFATDYGAVTWTASIPAYFERVLSVRVYDNAKDITAYVEFIVGGQVVDPVAAIMRLRGAGGVLEFSVRGQSGFTHVEIIIQQTGWPYIQIPSLPHEAEFERAETIISTSMEVGGDIPGLDRECVVHDLKHNRLWYVTACTPHLINNRELQFYEAEARYIHQSEILHNLAGT